MVIRNVQWKMCLFVSFFSTISFTLLLLMKMAKWDAHIETWKRRLSMKLNNIKFQDEEREDKRDVFFCIFRDNRKTFKGGDFLSRIEGVS